MLLRGRPAEGYRVIKASKTPVANERSSWNFISCARLIGVNIIIFCLLLILIEGLASYGLVFRDIITTEQPGFTKKEQGDFLAKRQHTKYDAELGWINEPNVYLPNIYGPGVYLRTNAQGFRNDHDINTAVPQGKTRLVCSGDSFTHGYGVDNAHTWCERLSALDQRLETVNMGEDGYGVDQAYLWYKRGAARIDHQIHLFAFITDDFYRTLDDSFLGYAKPRLEIEQGVVVAKNVPVPTRGQFFPWIAENMGNLENLRTVQFLKRALRKIKFSHTNSPQLTQKERDEKARQILRKIFEDLKRIDEKRSSKLVLIYLPTIWELEGRGGPNWTPPEVWNEFLKEESKSLDVPLINLFGKFRSLSHREMVDMFIPPEKLPYPEAAFHFSDRGNEMVAKVVYDKLINDPLISCSLSTRSLLKARETAHVGQDRKTLNPSHACSRS